MLAPCSTLAQLIILCVVYHRSGKSNLAIGPRCLQLLALCSCCATSCDSAHTAQYLRAQTDSESARHSVNTNKQTECIDNGHRPSSARGSLFQSSSSKLYRLHLPLHPPVQDISPASSSSLLSSCSSSLSFDSSCSQHTVLYFLRFCLCFRGSVVAHSLQSLRRC